MSQISVLNSAWSRTEGVQGKWEEIPRGKRTVDENITDLGFKGTINTSAIYATRTIAHQKITNTE
jgi:hypothetical protein